MGMQFKINKEYARRYTESRRKEELQKLQDRHGDVKLKKKKKRKKADDECKIDEEATSVSDTEHYSSSSSSSSDTDESSESQEHDEFLVLYDALCRNDPALDDPNKQWFHSVNDEANEDTPDQSRAKKLKKKKDPTSDSLKLRDYAREFLLTQGGIEDEQVAAAARNVSKLESDEILTQLTQSSVDDSKNAFLEASRAALEKIDASNDVGTDFLQRRKVERTEASQKLRSKIDVNSLRFIDNADAEAERFLHDFIVNKRWKRPPNGIPSYDEVLRDSQIANEPIDDFNLIKDENILDEDDDFLIKVHEFERDKQGASSNLTFSTGLPTVKHRFEEEDKEFIKSYPRKIQNTLNQSEADGKSARALKRQARRLRKQEEKRAKLAELNRLRRLKLAMLADKVQRIQRTCGSGCDLATVDLSEVKDDDDADVEDEPVASAAMDLAMHLDEDWDPEKHNALLERLFNEKYYQTQDDDVPKFSDASDLDSDLEDAVPSTKVKWNDHFEQREGSVGIPDVDESDNENGPSNVQNEEQPLGSQRRRRRDRAKHRLQRALARKKEPFDPTRGSDFDEYFEKHYNLTCEDIIPGPTPDEDFVCRFNYRQVKPNDFGLNTEEVLTASTSELNRWVPMTRVTGYRTEEEEERDERIYHSKRKLQKKTQVIHSLADPNCHWWPSEGEQSAIKPSEPQKKRKRSRKRRKHAHSEDENEHAGENQYKKIQGVNISVSRLAASGISSKELYKLKKRTKTDSET